MEYGRAPDAPGLKTHLFFRGMLAIVRKVVGRPSLPVIRQSEMSECGLACLAMLANWHKIKCNIRFLRRTYPTSSRGTNLRKLSAIASDLGLIFKAYRIEDLSVLRELDEPFIAHLVGDHFVVVKQIKDDIVVIHDPALGLQRLSTAEFALRFSGITVLLEPGKVQDKSFHIKPLSLLDLVPAGLKLAKPLTITFVLTGLFQLFVVISPLYGQYVIDAVIVKGNHDLLTTLAVGFVGALVLHVVIQSLREFYILHLFSRYSLLISENLFKTLLNRSIEFFNRRHTGDVMSRMDSTNHVRDLFARDLVSSLVDGVLVVIIAGIMLYYSVFLAAVVALFSLAYFAIRFAFYNPIWVLTEEKLVNKGAYDTYLIETLKSAKSIKVFGMQSRRSQGLSERMAKLIKTDVHLARWRVLFSLLTIVLFGLENIIIIFVAASLVVADAMSLGMFFAFMVYKYSFTSSFSALIDKLLDIRTVRVHLDRLDDIYDRDKPDSRHSLPASKPLADLVMHDLQVRDLSYRHSDDDGYVFRSINLRIPSGKMTVITGRSGCGKSTLLDCLTGIASNYSGTVLLGSNDIRTVANYYGNIAAVTQNDVLLSGTIAENIAYFDKDLDQAQVVACAQLACIDQDINQMPMNFNTMIGDMGATLSGGQMQRVLLARALYRRPSILFLDEASSQLDATTERLINTNLKNLDITRVVVAHRKETIDIADTVIDLEELQNDH